jgi:Protein of unknown function (DUF3891)
MIITRVNGSLRLVKQNDHARLARDLCERWGNARFDAPKPSGGMRLASELHDTGWRGPDDELRFNPETQRPLHFLEIGQDEHAEFYRHGVEEASARDPYAGLLVSMHWTGLYRARWGMQEGHVFIADDSPVAELQSTVVASEEQRWIELKRGLLPGVRRSEFEAGLWHNYELLQALDVMSLYVCTARLDAASPSGESVPVIATLKSIDHEAGPRTIESVPCRLAGERVDLILNVTEPGVVKVDPYPFDEPEIRVEVGARLIPDRPYGSPDDARAIAAHAETQPIGCVLTSV